MISPLGFDQAPGLRCHSSGESGKESLTIPRVLGAAGRLPIVNAVFVRLTRKPLRGNINHFTIQNSHNLISV